MRLWTPSARLVATLAAIALSASACVSVNLVPAGDFAVGSGHVTLAQPWNDVSALRVRLPKEARILTLDGPLLNQLIVVSGLPGGAALIPAVNKEHPSPTVRAGMTARERVEFVADSVAAMGYLHVETSGLRPGKLGAADGVRFDLTAQTHEGLDMKGTALVGESGGRLNLILFLAPAEHYYQAGLPAAEAVMTTARMG